MKVVSRKPLREMKSKRMTKLTEDNDDGNKRDNGVTGGKTTLTTDNDDSNKSDNGVTVRRTKMTKDNIDRTSRDSAVSVGRTIRTKDNGSYGDDRTTRENKGTAGRTKWTKDTSSDGDKVSRRVLAEGQIVSDNGYLLGEDGCELIRRIGLTDDALRRKMVQSVVGRDGECASI